MARVITLTNIANLALEFHNDEGSLVIVAHYELTSDNIPLLAQHRPIHNALPETLQKRAADLYTAIFNHLKKAEIPG